MSTEFLANLKSIDTSKAYILYMVNFKDDYKKQYVFMNLGTAKQFKQYAVENNGLSGDNVYVTKLIGFYDESYIHCTNGFKYNVNVIEKNEKNISEKKYMLLV
jgi:hypothetical protein